MRRPRGWLERADGVRVRVDERGLTLGRGPESDLILTDPRASHLQALVLPGLKGLEVIALGRNPTRRNDEPVNGRAALLHGDTLELPGSRFTVVIDTGRGWSRGAWMVELWDGTRVGVRALPFTLGGGPDDHLHIPEWPPGALRLDGAQGALALELDAGGTLTGVELPAGAVEALEPGDTLTLRGRTVRFQGPADEAESTVLAAAEALPVKARFQFLPNGGRLELGFADGVQATVELAELRANLVAALLKPPTPYGPGELVPDEVLAPAIWPGQPDRGRTDLNLLIHRTRKNLLSAGVNPSAVLARAAKGGATCFRLAPGADVSVS